MASHEKTARFPLPEGDLLATISAVNSQIFDFAAARFKEDMQTRHALFQASCIAQVLEIQTRFFQKAKNDYTAQASKLMDIGQTRMLDMTGATKA